MAFSNDSNQYSTFTPKDLHSYISTVLKQYNVPPDDADLAADVLLYSDIRGIDSHGIARLKTYCWCLEEERINPTPQMRIIKNRKSVATIDGDNGLGLVIAPKAMQIAIKKAKDFGSGWAAISNTNHYGAAGYYVEEARAHEQIGLSMTNTSKVVAPLWGRERRLGTNPIAVSFPSGEQPPMVIDFASSAVSFGKVEIQWRKQEELPRGWAITKEGSVCKDPEDFLKDACLLPLGSDKLRGGHKGYGLSAMVDILSAVLSGANWGPFTPPFAVGIPEEKERVGKGIGHFLGAWDVESFIDLDEFKSQMDHWIKVMRSTQPIDGKESVLIPGDPERIAMIERLQNGIPVIQAVVNDMLEISDKTGVEMPIKNS